MIKVIVDCPSCGNEESIRHQEKWPATRSQMGKTKVYVVPNTKEKTNNIHTCSVCKESFEVTSITVTRKLPHEE